MQLYLVQISGTRNFQTQQLLINQTAQLWSCAFFSGTGFFSMCHPYYTKTPCVFGSTLLCTSHIHQTLTKCTVIYHCIFYHLQSLLL